MNKTSIIAAAAAALFLAGAPALAATGDEEKVACDGMNACKGKSDCKTAHSECAGKNACKGQGMAKMSQADCDAAKAKAAGSN